MLGFFVETIKTQFLDFIGSFGLFFVGKNKTESKFWFVLFSIIIN